MVNFCAAVNCSNSQKAGSNIKFHRFPFRDKVLLKKWVLAVRRGGFHPERHHALCSLHFTKDSYLKGYVNRRRLKDDAVPSIFNFPEHLSETENSVEHSTRVLNKFPHRRQASDVSAVNAITCDLPATSSCGDHSYSANKSIPVNGSGNMTHLEKNQLNKGQKQLNKTQKLDKNKTGIELKIICPSKKTKKTKFPR